MELVKFGGWKNCVEIKSGDFKLIVTTAVGPRVIGGFLGDSENIFCVVPASAGKTGGSAWHLFGGHRLWLSPEAKPRSYTVENRKVKFSQQPDGGYFFSSGTDKPSRIHSSMTIYPLGGERFRVEHRLRNDNMWDVEVAAWAMSVMAAGGTAVVPQPQGDVKELGPNRNITLWPYTNMGDPRLTWGSKFTLMRQSKRASGKCKFGIGGEDGWLAYVNKGIGFIKSFEHLVDADYPDNGCSVECFTNRFMTEIETLSPLYLLAPGEELLHVEEWAAISGAPDVKTEKDAESLAVKVKAKLDAGSSKAPARKGARK